MTLRISSRPYNCERRPTVHQSVGLMCKITYGAIYLKLPFLLLLSVVSSVEKSIMTLKRRRCRTFKNRSKFEVHASLKMLINGSEDFNRILSWPTCRGNLNFVILLCSSTSG
jgi:hypothetical protein